VERVTCQSAGTFPPATGSLYRSSSVVMNQRQTTPTVGRSAWYVTVTYVRLTAASIASWAGPAAVWSSGNALPL